MLINVLAWKPPKTQTPKLLEPKAGTLSHYIAKPGSPKP